MDEVRTRGKSQDQAFAVSIAERDQRIRELEDVVSSLEESRDLENAEPAKSEFGDSESGTGALDAEAIEASQPYLELVQERDSLASQVAELESARLRDKAEVAALIESITSILEAKPDA